ncbi:hypothetical protein N7492_007056 [Penicillium capsulatum]|uniref:SET domain-containing protein n=1 Tax=Penicillium capsulatum TaxID=69766 RepID=A0A9W9I0J5_9EURO|nr:hypothetical protein N7492_007056 [Penicillium capsulatum]KAJ6116890.1 hypothetical protein N7512_006615 [Penicillium capsulatum]
MKREYLPLESLPAWLKLNGIVTNGISFGKIGSVDKDTDKGNAIVATRDLASVDSDASPAILLQVPPDLVLSLDAVHDYAKSDQSLREVLEAVGAIMIFLLLQITHSCPQTRPRIGVSSPWTEYIKFLPPSFPLPTSYSPEEAELLRGTSLATAVEAKALSLEREFDYLREATDGIAWCQRCWWAEDMGQLSLADWKYIDAAYRSRMVDLPGSGHAMVPCIDMANHAPEPAVKALYDTDASGNAVLQLRWNKRLCAGDEVTISYGDDKPASEMIFSYGFLESDRSEAKQVLLDMDMPDDDPLGVAKKMVCQETPGIRVSASDAEYDDVTTEKSNQITWDGPLVWWASVNEEDGLLIGVVQTTDGTQELETKWKGEKIQSPNHLRDLLAKDPLWNIFQLRAVVLVLERLETQMSLLQETDEVLSNMREKNPSLLDLMFRPDIFSLTARLRNLETALLQRARNDLMESESVTSYLTQQSQPDEVEDFS